MSLIRTEQFRAALAEWARRHGVDPATIPEASPFSRSPDGTWTVVDVNGKRITFAEQEPIPLSATARNGGGLRPGLASHEQDHSGDHGCRRDARAGQQRQDVPGLHHGGDGSGPTPRNGSDDQSRPVHMAAKQRWRIVRASCVCGGRWAWHRQRSSGAWESMGCVCHHPWTLVLRAAT